LAPQAAPAPQSAPPPSPWRGEPEEAEDGGAAQLSLLERALLGGLWTLAIIYSLLRSAAQLGKIQSGQKPR
jgi:hypothetical protein